MQNTLQKIDLFLQKWLETPDHNKSAFERLKNNLDSKENVMLDFISRPGITHSLRAFYKNQKKGQLLFILVDVIEDQPRWLSVCFYSRMISDTDERGVFIPQGILGDDAICFDLETHDNVLLEYIESLIDEAYQKAAVD